MRTQATPELQGATADEAAIRELPMRMIAAWNAGDAEGFASPFSDTADFIAFEGTHLKGRAEIAAFHRRLFSGDLKGTRLDGGVLFVRFLNPTVAVMHAWAGTYLAGHAKPAASRDSMQLFVVVQRAGAWRAEAMLNARRLTLEQQYFADELDELPESGQREVRDLAHSLLATHNAAGP